MTLLLDDAPPAESATDNQPATDFAERLRAETTGVRLQVRWFGVRKSLTPDQKERAADAFNAAGEFLSAGKKLLDTRHAAWKAVTQIRGQAVSQWKALSLPYPEPGLRLIRHDRIGELQEKIDCLKQELDTAVEQLDERYHELRMAAQERLGRLYNPSDYPSTLVGLFAIDLDYPSVEPPAYLQRLHPDLYRRECERVQQRFAAAVEIAEQAFLDELSKLIAHLTERLAGTEDGKPKVFRNSAVENLTEFFERFRQLNVGSSDQLDQLVQQAQQIVGGVRPQQLRDNAALRQRVATQLSGVGSVLDGLLVDRPRRNIMRGPR